MSKRPPPQDIIGPDKGLSSSNTKKIPSSPIAVAIQSGAELSEIPKIVASGRGKIAEQILQLAFEQGLKVREDADLAEILARIDLDSPIPSEAFLAVAEILSYVFRANGEPDPFNAILGDVIEEWEDKEKVQKMLEDRLKNSFIGKDMEEETEK